MSKLNIKNVRYFNNVSIVDNGKNILKNYIGNDKYYKLKFYDEIIWMIKAQEKIKKYIPNIIDYSLDKNDLWIKYKMIELNTIHDYFVNNKDLNWIEIEKAYEDFISNCKQYKPQIFIESEWKNKLIDFYLERTINNLMKIKEKAKLKIFFKADYLYINDEKYPSLKPILKLIKEKINNLQNNSIDKNDYFYRLTLPNKDRIFLTHLDLIFGNVFFDDKKNIIKVIDPRGSFADSKEYGDIYYDYAKIYQSIYGLYDFIVEDKFDIKKTEENSFYINIEQNKNIDNIRKILSKLFPQQDIEIIKLLEAIQFFAMTPAHNDNANRQIVQLFVGIKHMTDILGNEIWKR